MLAIPTSDDECGRFGRQGGSADDDAGYADELRNIVRGEVADGQLRGVGVKKQLMIGKLVFDVLL